MSWKLITGLSIIIAALIFALGRCSKDCDVVESTTTTIDTTSHIVFIPQIVYRDTGTVKIKYRIIDKSRIDTVKNGILAGIDTTDFPVNIDSSGLYLTPAFSFGYHTISAIKDTFEIKYFFPENRIEFAQFPAPREKVIETIKETITIYIEKPKAWYQEEWFEWSVRGALFIGGAYAGSQIGGSK